MDKYEVEWQAAEHDPLDELRETLRDALDRYRRHGRFESVDLSVESLLRQIAQTYDIQKKPPARS